MRIREKSHVVYGLQIERPDEDTYWRILEEQAEKVTDAVRMFSAGEYDNDDCFLVTSFQECRPGVPFLVGPYAGTDGPYLEWDAELVKAAELLGVKTIRQPGWLFIPDEG